MPSPTVLQLYQRLAPKAFFLERAHRYGTWRKGIYALPVLLWLMIFQRLDAKGTLARAVAQLLQRHLPSELMVGCKRLREARISANTSGYCRARQKLPPAIVEELLQQILIQLQRELRRPHPPLAVPAFVLDGSSLQLAGGRELRRCYPPPENQHGRAHWPVLRLVVLQDLASGLALRPVWGPMYGRQAVSEQALAEQALGQLPTGAVVVGDRNFGIFAIAYAAQQQGHPVLLRLTQSRAASLARPLRPGEDRPLLWRPSRWDRQAHPQLPPEAAVWGRLLVCPRPGWRCPLYLFTTLPQPPQEIAQLYGLRWHIETDLRALKQTVRLHQITARSADMMEKELLVAIAAYNLVRAVMCAAAQQAHLPVRQLSFSRVQDLVEAFLDSWASGESPEPLPQRFQRLLQQAASCKLPQRRRRRSYPRAVWGRGYRYPRRKP